MNQGQRRRVVKSAMPTRLSGLEGGKEKENGTALFLTNILMTGGNKYEF